MPQKRDFISIMDWSSEELIKNLELALELKKKTREGQCPKELEGRSYGMIFHKDSLRTRVSCEVAIFQLGGHVLTMSEKDFQMGKRESVKDVAKVLSRYLDGILIRTFSHQVVLELAEHAEVPVCNLLTDFNHPCQLMADALTILEKFGRLENIKVCYLGDCNNVTNSWLNLASRIPLDIRIATSKETLPAEHLLKQQAPLPGPPTGRAPPARRPPGAAGARRGRGSRPPGRRGPAKALLEAAMPRRSSALLGTDEGARTALLEAAKSAWAREGAARGRRAAVTHRTLVEV